MADTGPALELTVGHVAAEPELRLDVIAGESGLENEIAWVHVIEIEDPTPFLSGGEFVLATGLGIGRRPEVQRAYLGRLADAGAAGLGFGVGVRYADVPHALADEADRLGFPVVSVPYDVPFIAITRYAFTRIAEHRLRLLTAALEIQERLVGAALSGVGLEGIVGMLCSQVHCSASLFDSTGTVLAERRVRTSRQQQTRIELPITTGGADATLKVASLRPTFSEYELLVLRHAQIALGFELSRRGAVSAAELRVAGDLVDDLKHERLDEGEAVRRLAAFGFDADTKLYPLLVLVPKPDRATDARAATSRTLELRGVRHLSTVRDTVATFILQIDNDEDLMSLATELAQTNPTFRLSLGRGRQGRLLGSSLLEAQAALQVRDLQVVTYRDLGPFELLLNLPSSTLDAFVERTLGALLNDQRLMDSLIAILSTRGRWSEAARTLGVHRHTLRHRITQVQQRLGRDPCDPSQQFELWLAVLAMRAQTDRFEPRSEG